jgi:hypothetical protein
MTGALPAPPIIAHFQSNPKPEAPKKKLTAAKQKRRPALPAERSSVPHAFTAATPTATPEPKAKVSRRSAGPKKTKIKVAGPASGSSLGEFGFEGSGGSPSPRTSSGAVASASSAQSSGGSSRSGRTGSAPKGPTGGEFGFEGG